MVFTNLCLIFLIIILATINSSKLSEIGFSLFQLSPIKTKVAKIIEAKIGIRRFTIKSRKLKPVAPPIMILGGSPIRVKAPPILENIISAKRVYRRIGNIVI